MPIFLKENQELNDKVYKMPKSIQNNLINTAKIYNTKWSKYHADTEGKYNNKGLNIQGNHKDGKRMSYNDIKKIDHEFRHMSKNPNSYERLSHGGEEMANYVRNLLSQERNRVAPVLKQKKIQTRNKNQVKPVANPTKPISINSIKVNLEESYDIEEHPYYDKLNEYNTYYVLESFENKENLWIPLINPDMYKKALLEFTKFGKFIKFPTKYIYQWMGIIMKNTALLRACTEICGHSQFFPVDEFVDFYFEGDYDKWEEYKSNSEEDSDYYVAWDFLEEKGFDEWNVLPDGSDAISDYGIEPIEKIIFEYNRDLSPEKVIVLINKILDVTHQRGDLASIFIEGGSKTLTKISEERKIKKIYIKEDKLNLLNL